MEKIIGLVAFCFFIWMVFDILNGMNEDSERMKAERKQQENQEAKEKERIAHQKQWERDAPMREAARVEQEKLCRLREQEAADYRARMIPILKAAEADGHEVCYVCFAIDPKHCPECGKCNHGGGDCSHCDRCRGCSCTCASVYDD